MIPVYKYYSTPTGSTQILMYRRKATYRKKERIFYIKQKLSGLTLAAIGIIIPLLFNGDATASVLTIPLGLYLLFTKRKVMMF